MKISSCSATTGICCLSVPAAPPWYDIQAEMLAYALSLQGSLAVVRRAQEARHKLPFDRARLLVLPVATRFEARIEYELAQHWLKTFAREIGPLYADWAHKDVSVEELLTYARIPYIPYWSFGEKLPVIEKGTEDPDDIGFYLETLGAMVAQKLTMTDVLAKHRDSYVVSAQRFPVSNGAGGRRKREKGASDVARIFISYSHKDRDLLDRLLVHLQPLARRGVIELWDDRRIAPGEEWVQEIDSRLQDADIILLLISADYLASDWIYENEIKRILERHNSGEVRLIPVILRPTHWNVEPFSSLQALPRDGVPVTLWKNSDDAWANVTEGVLSAVSEIKPLRARSH